MSDDNSAQPFESVIPQDLDGRYSNLKPILEREVSCSFEARDNSNGRLVFIKLLRERAVGDATATQIFLREPMVLRALARRAPRIPVLPVLHIGEWQGRPYFVLPLLTGWSLNHAMRAKLCFAPRSALRIIEECLVFLDQLHGAGYAHGDLSPDNIFIQTAEPVIESGVLPDDAIIRILDFNSATALEHPDPSLNFVKPSYAAPEIWMSQPASVRSDIYAVGMLFFELLAGSVPYRLGKPSDLEFVTQDSIPPLPSAAEVPRLVAAFIRELLTVNPGGRPTSASECLRRLADFQEVHDWWFRTQPPDAARLKNVFKPAELSPPTGTISSTLRPARRPTSPPLRPPPPPPKSVPSEFDRLFLPPSPDGPSIITSVPAREMARPAADLSPRSNPGSEDFRRDECSIVPQVGVPSRDRRVDRVDFSVFAPASVSPGRSFILEVWAYLRAQRDEMLARATSSQRVERGSRGPVVVERATELTLLLRLDGFSVSDPQDSIFWDGDVTNAAFIVEANKELSAGIYPGQLSILHCGMLLSRLVFDVVVGTPVSATKNLEVRQEQFRSAFASYASADRDEVLRRVQGIEAAGVRVFVDVLNLRAGQDWEDRILRSIRDNDIFYLFWSVPASQSEWVEREWRWALKERGLNYIHPIPLADPGTAPPPPELASRHFNDLILACLKSQNLALRGK